MAALRWVALVVLFLTSLGGCGGESVPAPGPPVTVEDACTGECSPGEMLLEDGCCQPAGLPPDMLCRPGEWLGDRGGCQPAGLPPACPSGDQLLESSGCPTKDCPKGQMVIPGETECHEIAPCGPRDYGDIPVDPMTQFVNLAYTGEDSDGSEAKPWKTIWQGIDAAAPGAIVAVAEGSYVEDVIIEDKPVILWGRCPALVEVSGTGVQPAAVQVLDANAAATEIRGVAITGLNRGLVVSGATGVRVQGVWIHDTLDSGLEIKDVNGPTSATVTASVIEATHTIGVLVHGSDADVFGLVVRDIQPDGAGNLGHGIAVQDDAQTNKRARVQITSSVVERTHDIGVLVTGSDADLAVVVVRDIQPNEAGKAGYGIVVRNNPLTNQRAGVNVTASLVERNHEAGVLVTGSDVELTTVAVRDTQPNEAGEAGRGIEARADSQMKERASLRITDSVIERSTDVGVLVTGSDADLAGIVVRDTQSNGAGKFGRGIQVQDDSETNERSKVQIMMSLVERNREMGVLIYGSDAELTGIVVRDTQPDGAGNLGRGIQVQHALKTNGRSSVRVMASLVEQNRDAGVLIASSDATIEGSIVRGTSARRNGGLGDGIVVVSYGLPAEATVIGTVINSNDRAGLANWGGLARFTATVLSCNAFDLQGEVFKDSPFAFPDSHDNLCGCPAVADVCSAVSSGILPPPPLDDLPIPDSPSSP